MKHGFLLLDERKNAVFLDAKTDKDTIKQLFDYLNLTSNMSKIKEHRTLGDLDLYVHNYIKKRGDFDDQE